MPVAPEREVQVVHHHEQDVFGLLHNGNS
jgi:hypothetical protein